MSGERVVVTLEIDARGVEAGSAASVKALKAAQAGYDRVLEAQNKASVASQKGATQTIREAETIARASASWDRLRGSVDQVAAAEIRARKEVERATIAADNAVKRGVASQHEAARAVDLVRQRQAALVAEARSFAAGNPLETAFKAIGAAAQAAQRQADQAWANMARGAAAAARAAQEAARAAAPSPEMQAWLRGSQPAGQFSRVTGASMGGGPGVGSGDAGFTVMAARGVAAVAAVMAVKRAVEEAAGGIARASDQVNTLNARLNVLTGAAQGSREAFGEVYKIAQRAGVGIADTAGAFSRLAIAAGEFGASSQQIATVVDTLTKLGRVGGATTAELSSGILQLGQALASGALQGDELRSIRENLPLVAQAIAKEFGVATGELKRLGAEGKLTADRVFSALTKANAEATRQFQQMPPTVEQASTRAANAMTVVTAEFGKWTGLADLFTGKLNQIAAGFEVVARGIGLLNDPAVHDRRALGGIDKELADLRAQQGRPRTWFSDITGNSQRYITEQIAILEERRRAIEARQTDRAYDAGIAANDQTFTGMARAAAAAEARRTAAMVEVGKIRATYDPLIKFQTELAEAKKKYDAAVAAGAITQAHANEELAKYGRHLLAAGSAGKETAKSIEALSEATAAADFSGKLADAAYSGAHALAEIEAQAQAAKKAMDLFGGKRDVGFEGRFSAALLADRQNKAIRDFRESTLGIERENQLLQKQLELIGQRPEIVDREIAALRVRLDLEARGVTVSETDLQRRIDAMTVQERLTRETEESRRAAELWAEPFKNAIQGVQSTITGLFENALSGSIRSIDDAAQGVKRIWFRLMAELASAAIIRPVIQFAVGGLGQLGILGPQTMQAMGVSSFGGAGRSSGGGSGGLGSLLGGGGLGGGGGGWLSRQLGSIGSWLNTPFSSMGASLGGAGSLGAFGGSLANSSFFGSLTPMNAIGAVGGIGSGIFQLATGGGSASSIIGGIGSMIGAGVSLIPGIGQVAGPIISIASSILGSLFKSKPQYAAQGFHSYNPASGRYGGRVGYETNMKAPLAPSIGNDALKLIGAYGGSVAPGMAAPEYYIWRGFEDGRMDATVTAEGSPTYRRLLEKVWASGQIKTTDEAQWAARTELWTDDTVGGEWAQLPINSLTTDSEKLMQQLALLILKAGVRDGAFTGLSETSQKIIRNYPDADTEGLAQALEWGKKTYDVMIRADEITAAEKAFGDLRDSFQAAILKAEEFRLATDKLVEGQRRALNKYATDFQQTIDDRILGIQDPAELARVKLDREFDLLRKEAAYINEQYALGLIDTLVDINKLEQAYGLERERIVSEQLTSLMDLWKRLTYGDLSNASPVVALAGARGTYDDVISRARAGSSIALGELPQAAEDLINAQRAYTGNNAAFETLRLSILSDIAPWAAANRNGGPTVSFAPSTESAMTNLVAELAEGRMELARLNRNLAEQSQRTADLERQVSHLLSGML